MVICLTDWETSTRVLPRKMERKKNSNIDDKLKKKMKNWESKEERGLNEETIQLMTGKFQLETIRNFKNFLDHVRRNLRVVPNFFTKL